MMRKWFLYLFLLIVLAPLTFTWAETITWNATTTYTDNTPLPANIKNGLTYYLRVYKSGSPAAKTYLGETRNGVTTWVDNVMIKANQFGAEVPGWVALKVGDTVYVTVSASVPAALSATGVEVDGPEGTPKVWVIPDYTTPPPPTQPACSPPAGVTITK
jgi:hypothetical protein